jgi:hypothetical protein
MSAARPPRSIRVGTIRPCLRERSPAIQPAGLRPPGHDRLRGPWCGWRAFAPRQVAPSPGPSPAATPPPGRCESPPPAPGAAQSAQADFAPSLQRLQSPATGRGRDPHRRQHETAPPAAATRRGRRSAPAPRCAAPSARASSRARGLRCRRARPWRPSPPANPPDGAPASIGRRLRRAPARRPRRPADRTPRPPPRRGCGRRGPGTEPRDTACGSPPSGSRSLARALVRMAGIRAAAGGPLPRPLPRSAGEG